MSKKSAWPKHFYLVAPGVQPKHHKPGPLTMGSKAFNLLEMLEIGLNIPAAAVIGTHYSQDPEACLQPLFGTVLPALEKATGQILGDARYPLLLSVRSGAPVSMPGMMETLLNIGLCDATVPGFLRQTGNPRLVWDAYRRLVSGYGEVVAGLDACLFEKELDAVCAGREERELDFSELRALTRSHLAAYELASGHPFPQSPCDQLRGAVLAVFASWHADKARAYRQLHGIAEDMGTAVTLQRMVFGNAGIHSGSGVGFTRNPMTGEAQPWIDYLSNAQGEDVVSGRRNAHGSDSLARALPLVWSQLQDSMHRLEARFGDMQDFEFTVQDRELFLLQTRAGKRTQVARARIALDLLAEGAVDAITARSRLRDLKEDDLARWVPLSTQDDGSAPAEACATAASASAGWVSGEIALDEARAQARHAGGVPVILVRRDAETSDIAALDLAQGLLTQRGARTSHAAVVARHLGKACLVGCSALTIDLSQRSISLGSHTLREGEWLTLDGDTGRVYAGQITLTRQPIPALIQAWKALIKG